jgi:RNA polymerase sigma-70 factor (ECF subfamily)
MEIEREIEELHAASFGWALSCCGRNHQAAEEVLQDVYVKIFEGKARFDGRSTLKTWLFSVIRRTAASQARQRILHDLLTAKWARRELDAVSPMPDAAAQHSETSVALIEALRKLARRQREVLELVFYHDMTVEEAAAAMHVSLGSARVHYDRGKKQLLARLNGKLSR